MSSKLAMQFCFSYDSEMLVPHLAYHRFLGVSKVYVYLDQYTPRTLSILNAFDFVECLKIDPLERSRFSRVPYLQMACMNDAMQRARSDGFDWLMSIDIDEFAMPLETELNHTKPASVLRDGLTSMLDQIASNVDVVQLRVKEVVPFYCNERFEFWRQHYFQSKTPIGRELLNVETGEIRLCGEFMSHSVGKSIARTSASIQSHGPHGWSKDQGRRFPLVPFSLNVSSINRGCIYHFFAFQNSHFLKKFKEASREPSLYANGEPIAFPRQCFKAASSKLTGATLVGYLNRYFYLRKHALEKLVHQQAIEYDATVERVLWHLGVLSFVSRCSQRIFEFFDYLSPVRPLETARLWCDIDQHELMSAVTQIYWDASMWPETLCSGFFLPEIFEGKCLRWGSPEAALHLKVKPAKYKLALDFGSLADEALMRLVRVQFNSRALGASELSAFEGRLYFEIDESDCQSAIQILKISCPAIDTSNWPVKELRQIAFPLFGIDISQQK